MPKFSSSPSKWIQGANGTNVVYSPVNLESYVGIGTRSPNTRLHVLSETDYVENIAAVEKVADTTNPAELVLRKARGTASSKSVVQNGDNVGYVYFQGYDGDEYVSGALIDARVNGVPGNNDMPMRLNFRTTPDGSNALIERMRIYADGGVTVPDATETDPTGGSKGAGTINAKAVYDDNVLLTDHVFDAYFDGDINYHIPTLDELANYMQRERRLPMIKGRTEWIQKGKPSTGELLTQIWEQLEHAHIYIKQLHDRIKVLEAK